MDYRERYDRPDYDTYFMNMAFLVSTRTTCRRRSVGAVIVKDQRILSTGYNGAPKGVKDCLELGFCVRQQQQVPSGQRHELCRGVHAEQNAIANAAYFGVAINSASIYMTESPCNICTKILINSGIRKIIYANRYMDDLSSELLKESNIEVQKFQVRATIEDFTEE
ncbi:MAG: dCMP deaminase family protein [Candidatus Thermoplasmatota archaeon]|nr:dCMP deaminase family protein [Candidatus Thermoplasmatota archaeon]